MSWTIEGHERCVLAGFTTSAVPLREDVAFHMPFTRPHPDLTHCVDHSMNDRLPATQNQLKRAKLCNPQLASMAN